MRWFGSDWGAPICEMAPHSATPTGEACGRCGETIEADDNGLTTPYLAGCGMPGEVHYHHLCFMAVVVPVVVHALREGLPLCGFTKELPIDWPEGHFWDTRKSRINCEVCLVQMAAKS